jgi:hypothetical protein
MLPAFLIPEMTLEQNGEGPAVEVTGEGPMVLLTLGIQQVREQQSLLLTIQGSPDEVTWQAIVEFPQKFYSGISSVLVDLGREAGVRYLRAVWKVDRWGRGDKTPRFRLYLAAETLRTAAVTAD